MQPVNQAQASETPELPHEMWVKIAQHTLEGRYVTHYHSSESDIRRLLAPLRVMQVVSKAIRKATRLVEGQYVQAMEIPLNRLGLGNANAQIDYAISQQLTRVAMRPRMQEGVKLERLLREDKRLNHLSLHISASIVIQEMPENLKTLRLIAHGVTLPPLTELEDLHLEGCIQTVIRGPFPKLKRLYLTETCRLDGSPMPQLMDATLSQHKHLDSLPQELPELSRLTLLVGGLLKLPRMAKLKELNLLSYSPAVVPDEVRKTIEGNGGKIEISPPRTFL